MKKKLQVFISSTYLDLKEERQAAVEAILSAGHIPAGMELFAAGDVSQLEIIKKWIEESDVYMLILGGRYGAIDTATQKSYTHIEYEYAMEKGIPFFSVFATDNALSIKEKRLGIVANEKEHPDKYFQFKKIVLSKICRPFEDAKDIKIAIHESLKFLQDNHEFYGWVSVKDLNSSGAIAKDNLKLTKENEDLRRQLQERANAQIDGTTYEEIINVLSGMEIKVPYELRSTLKKKDSNVWELFITCHEKFLEGVQNEYANQLETFLYNEIAPKLQLFGIVQRADLAGSMYHRFRITSEGKRLLKYKLIKDNNEETINQDMLNGSQINILPVFGGGVRR